MDGSMVLHHDGKEASRSPDDILVRRLKNRERQRRYRARKRQEADLRKALGVDQSTPLHFQQMHTDFLSVPLEVEISVSGTSPNSSTRIHCQRDWKKDARAAHMHKKQQTCSLENGDTVISAEKSATFVDGGHQDSLLSNHSDTTIPDNTETRALPSSRRHWKEEARNKRNSDGKNGGGVQYYLKRASCKGSEVSGV